MNGNQNPIGVCTLPLDPLQMRRSEHRTDRTDGPQSGQRVVSVSSCQTLCGEAWKSRDTDR